ncbi:MAG: hypothetical protein JSS62_00020 [Verrucomicrobia bacterium]|nr:hypothetical protein [Verrucomicrobiota bacterium]MBS0646523.1 hypothetical protein [Verrucomicrobiota bacterium]
MKLLEFFATHRIFRIEELSCLGRQSSTIYNLLAYHQKKGHILRIRRGLYYVVYKGIQAEICPVNVFLVAAKLADDAILAYRTALDFFGILHFITNAFIYLSKRKESESFLFQGVDYSAVSFPKALQVAEQTHFEVIEVSRENQKILVTSLERTLVDVLDRPHLCGSWEDIWRSLEKIEYLDFEKIISYVLLLKNATTAAKVGFFLESHSDFWTVPNACLSELQKHIPKRPHYLQRDRKDAHKLLKRWNLIVPTQIINRAWEEPGMDVIW